MLEGIIKGTFPAQRGSSHNTIQQWTKLKHTLIGSTRAEPYALRQLKRECGIQQGKLQVLSYSLLTINNVVFDFNLKWCQIRSKRSQVHL